MSVFYLGQKYNSSRYSTMRTYCHASRWTTFICVYPLILNFKDNSMCCYLILSSCNAKLTFSKFWNCRIMSSGFGFHTFFPFGQLDEEYFSSSEQDTYQSSGSGFEAIINKIVCINVGLHSKKRSNVKSQT